MMRSLTGRTMSTSVWLVLGMAILTAGGAAIGLTLRKLATGGGEPSVAVGALIAGLGAVGIGVAVAMHSSPSSSWIQLGFGAVFITGVLVQARARSIQA
jgi:hypothetical protein